MSIKIRHAVLGSAAAAALVALCAPAITYAQEAIYSFNIPAQDLGAELRAYARATRQQIVFDGATVRGKTGGPVVGRFTAGEGLDRLLAGSGLVSRRTASGVIYVELGQESAGQQSAPEKPATVQEVVVTGTNIRGAPSTSPLQQYTRQDIEQMGAGTTDQFIRDLPQNFSLVTAESFNNNGSNVQALENGYFGSGVNLHGVGSGSTLVLLNGERLPAAGLNGSFVDVSLIPLSAIDHVDVLTDGASSIYGADAVAGVVNFILRKDYSGAETTLRYGNTTDGGGETTGFSQVIGHSWDTGNALIAYDNSQEQPIEASQRRFVPNQGGEFQVTPRDDRNSVFGIVHQSLGSDFDVAIQGIYSRRFFSEDTIESGVELSQASGPVEEFGGSATLGANLPHNWRVELSGQYGQLTQHLDSPLSFAGFVFPETSASRTSLTDAALRGDGDLLSLPGGEAKASIGAEWRHETFDDLDPAKTGSVGSGLQRNVESLYGETLFPLIGDGNAIQGAERLQASVSARYDNYDEFGGRVDPKIGILWSPIQGLDVRSTFGTSFRAPELADTSSAGQIWIIQSLPNPASPTGTTRTLFSSTRQNPGLGAERAQSETIGFDFRPQRIEGFDLSATYFHINYKDRISAPPLLGSIANLFFQTSTLSPFIVNNPSSSQVQAIINSAQQVKDRTGLGAAGVQAIYDGRLQNISASDESGLDVSISYHRKLDIGEVGVFLAGTHLFDIESKSASTTPSVNLLDAIYNPPSTRFRAGGTWSRDGWSAGLTANYTSRLHNDLLVPPGAIGDWTTIDMFAAYRFSQDGWGRGVEVMLNVQNLFDLDPPRVQPGTLLPAGSAFLGYDGVNASAEGRFIGVLLRKKW